MEVHAKAKHIRIAPRKVRLVADLVRGKDIGEALAILRLTQKRGTEPIEKVVLSAVANAENNNKMDAEKLYISEIRVDEGPTLKRFRPRAQGRASRINKRTSHITVKVQER